MNHSKQPCVVATNRQFLSQLQKRLRRRNVRVCAPDELSREDAGKSLYVARLSDLRVAKRIPKGARLVISSEGMLAEEMEGIYLPEKWHMIRQEDSIPEVVERMVTWNPKSPSETPPIADARLQHGHLVLFSPSFELLLIPLSDLSRFIGEKAEEIARFEIDSDGSTIYWPHADVHMGWQQFKNLVDPASVLAQKQRATVFNKRYGKAIRLFREECQLTQSEMGISDRQLRRVEKGEERASKKTLEALAEAHSLSLNDYLEALAQRLK